jgi:hypothetical protein
MELLSRPTATIAGRRLRSAKEEPKEELLSSEH